MGSRCILLSCVLASACGSSLPTSRTAGTPTAESHAPTLDAAALDLSDDPQAAALAKALDARLTVWTRRDGTRVHTRHCRRAPGGCEARIAAMARLMASAAREHQLDPFLLAAIAIRESGLDPTAVGAVGEVGIVQLHPRGVGRGLRYVEDVRYRERCAELPEACQREVVDRGASHLAEAIRRCGDVRGGLGAYNAGRCSPGRRYVDRVLDERRRLRSLRD